MPPSRDELKKLIADMGHHVRVTLRKTSGNRMNSSAWQKTVSGRRTARCHAGSSDPH
jgi:arsenate reductase-like glutaredoxin family protein